jgi:hypothetical protein
MQLRHGNAKNTTHNATQHLKDLEKGGSERQRERGGLPIIVA